jgi:outer membrane protein
MSQYLKTALMTAALALFAGHATAGWAQDARIATVDTETLMRTSDEGKAANEKIEKRFQTMSAELEKARKEIEAKETSLREQTRTLSDAVRAQRAKEIDDDKIRFDRKNQDYEKEITELQNELLKPVSDRMLQQLDGYVKERGFTILIDLSVQGGNVVWANPRNDVTQDVLKRMNEASKAAAAPAKPATAPATPPKPPAAPANPAKD